ncbi:MAG TPA: serine--tRNA ligase [Longimicrobiaceae bacterium]|nr:serine--tRNA ligase [Longimicrobiaceae bacterium]
MLDLKRIRQEPEQVLELLARRGDRGSTHGPIFQIRDLDLRRRTLIADADARKAQQNAFSREIAEQKRLGRPGFQGIIQDLERQQRLKEELRGIDEEIRNIEGEIEQILLRIPNTPDASVPPGGEESNRVVRSWGEVPSFDFTPRPHWEIGAELGILDLPTGAKITGSGFPTYRGIGARLQRALINWMLDLHTREHGYTEVQPPFLVNRAAITGTGQLPKFEEDLYLLPNDDLFLVPTAEVPVTNFHREQLLDGEQLPIAYTAYSPCFRREAGAAGKDTRGLLRLHQFDKVEMVRFERQESSFDALERMVGHAERVLQLLGLPYRVVLLAAGDASFASAKTYDLEVWAAGVDRWLEVSSCSNCTDFQARRAGIRYRPAAGEKPEFVHTLNGSGVALPRTLIALIENGQRADGTVEVPEVLRPYLGTDRLAG